jgi:protein-S-isoprenylcysteine O-methyltransferase Ste14
LLPPTLCFPPVRVIFAFVLIGLRCVRIPIEEKALRAGLEGYDEYAAHARYGLIPHV